MRHLAPSRVLWLNNPANFEAGSCFAVLDHYLLLSGQVEPLLTPAVLTAAAIQCLVWTVSAPAKLLTAKFPCYLPCCRLYPPWLRQVSRLCSTLLVAARCLRPSNVWPGVLSTWSLALQLETYQRSGCCALRHQQQDAEVSTARGVGDNRQRPDCCSECTPAAQSCFSAGRTGPYIVLLARSRTLMLLTAVRAGMLRSCCMAGRRWVLSTPVQVLSTPVQLLLTPVHQVRV